MQEKCAQSAGLSDLQMIPIYISLAQTYADLSQYKQASLYYNKELACRTGDHVQVFVFVLLFCVHVPRVVAVISVGVDFVAEHVFRT